jgi:hypothetical protein
MSDRDDPLKQTPISELDRDWRHKRGKRDGAPRVKFDADSFRNCMCVLHSIDYVELVAAGAIDDGDLKRWAMFQKEPYRFYISTDDDTRDRIWDIVARRHANGQRGE